MPFQRVRKIAPFVLSFCSDLRRWKAVARPVVMALAVLAGVSSVAGQTAGTPAFDAKFGKVPLNFEPNRGQVDPAVQYLSRGPGYSLYLTPGEAVLQLQSATESSTLRMTLVGADREAPVTGEQPLPGTVNYFVGNESSKWRPAVPTFGKVSYTAVYPGVDLVYYGNQRELEYDFVVSPGADAAKIALQFTGATPVIDKAGDLVLTVQSEEARFHKPVVYQLDGDRKVSVEGRYQIAEGKVGFALGKYDHSKPLVIDPVLSYVTYIGGSKDDTVKGMAVDSQGNVIIVGTTGSVDYPVKNAFRATDPNVIALSNPLAIFVSKFNATGTALVYSTYLGSSEYTYGSGVAVDSSGNAYVAGYTAYGDYPVTAGAFQTICGANNTVPQGSSVGVRINGCGGAGQGGQSGVLTKLDPTGSSLVYSTYLSGGNGNLITAVAVNAAGEAYVTGLSNAVCPGPYNANGTGYQGYFCIPLTANASEPPNNTGANADTYAFMVKFNAQGSGLLYSTVLGNHNPVGHYASGMQANAIALDAAGNAYVTGNMDANYFITTTTGSLQPARLSGSLPAFVAKFNPAGTAATSLVYISYLSGTTVSNDIATGIAVDGSGNAVVTGYTNSCTFPTTAGAFSTVPGGYVSQNICAGGFLTKLNPTGSGLVWSTYTGNNGANGRNNDDNDAVALGTDGSVYVAGDEQGVALNPTVNPILTQVESHFAYIKHFKADGSAVVFSSAIGGTADATSIPSTIFVDAANNIYLAGSTNSATWPTTPGAFQKNSANPGVNYNDGFVVKIAPTSTTTTALTLPPGTVTAGQSAIFTAKVTGQTGPTATPTGTVTFLSGSTTLGTGTIDATGTATYTASSLNATTYSVTASYAGDSAFTGSISAAQNLVVTAASPSVTLTAPATSLVGASVTLSVTVTGTPGTPTGTIIFKDGTAILSIVSLASGAASYSTSALAAGTHSLTVSYSGDSIFAATTTSAKSLVVSLGTASVALTAPATALVGASVTLTTAVTGTGGTPTGTVVFKDGTATLSTATLVSGGASFSTASLAAGAHSITVSYSGDSIFAAATSAASTVTINVLPAISFTASPTSLTIVHGASGMVTITGTPVGGYSGTVTFACGSVPTSAACTFSPTTLSFTGASTAQSTTLTFSTSTTTGMLGQPEVFGRTATTIVLAVLLMPLGFARQSRRVVRGAVFAVLLMVGLVAGLSGCSSSSKTTLTTPVGTYTVPITVTAGGVASTISLSVVVQ